MVPDRLQAFLQSVNLRTIILALLVGIIGVVLLALANSMAAEKVGPSIVRDLGSLLFLPATLTLIWELWAKRAFLDEILAKAQISKELSFAGIVKITDSFHNDIDWKSYFRSVNKLDIFFAYGQTWRNVHRRELQDLASREGARIRVVLPDPEDQNTVDDLARRFGYSSERLRSLISEATSDFLSLRPTDAAQGGSVEIWHLPATPVFSFYRFDGVGILALYNHRKDRAPVPTFVCEMGGTLYDYIRTEFEAMIRQGGLAHKFER